MIARKNNFDLLRLLLASMVFLVHLSILTQSTAYAWIPKLIHSQFAIDSFFVISGFLVYMSYDKSKNMKDYFSKRFRRIYPAYFVVIILAALSLMIFSTLSWKEYYTHPDFLKYVLCNLVFLNFLHPNLPGVFTGHYLSAVNGALWTIKIEIMFYLFVPVIAYFLNKYPKLLILALLYSIGLIWTTWFQHLALNTGKMGYLELSRQLPGQLPYFCVGIFAYCYYPTLKKTSFLLFITALAGVVLNYFWPINLLFWPLIVGAIVIYVGNFAYYLGNFGKVGDMSYGVYIVHFPVIQALITLGVFQHSPLLGFLLAAFTVGLLAWLSWHGIEKRFLFAQSHYKKEALK